MTMGPRPCSVQAAAHDVGSMDLTARYDLRASSSEPGGERIVELGRTACSREYRARRPESGSLPHGGCAGLRDPLTEPSTDHHQVSVPPYVPAAAELDREMRLVNDPRWHSATGTLGGLLDALRRSKDDEALRAVHGALLGELKS